MSSIYSYLPSFRRSIPVEDAPLDRLPPVESEALDSMETRVESLLISGTGLHEADPWRSLSEKERRQLLLRFLRYQLLNVDKAEEHLRRVASWRTTDMPWSRDLSCVRGETVGLPIMTPHTRGRANEIMIFLPACEYIKAIVDRPKQETGITTFFEYCAYQKEGLRASAGVMLVDFSDLLMKNVDLITARYAIRVFMEYYPEVFSKILFINYPKWIHGTWKVLCPLLDARTVAKVVWLPSGVALRSELGKFFHVADLPTWLGGNQKVGEIDLFTGQKLTPEDLTERLFSQ